MERDFLGINSKEEQQKQQRGNGRQDSASFGGSAMHWPFSNNLGSMQQFLSFKAPHEGAGKKVEHEQHVAQGFNTILTADAYEASRRASPVFVQQKNINLEGQSFSYSMQSYPQAQGIDPFGVAKHHHSSEARTFPLVSHHSIPMATRSPFFKVHDTASVPNFTVSTPMQQHFGASVAANMSNSGSTNVGTYAPRNQHVPMPMAAQLTIFYAGTVNVFDNIPLDKAQAIMFLASTGSLPNSNVLNQRPETPMSAPAKVEGTDVASVKQKVSTNQSVTASQSATANRNQARTPPPHKAPSCSGIPSLISITSQNAVSSTSKVAEAVVAKPALSAAPTSQMELPRSSTNQLGSSSNSTLVARAVPQARRASLARFLEKRKERVADAVPYSSPKKTSEEPNCPDKADLNNKVSRPTSIFQATWRTRGILENPRTTS